MENEEYSPIRPLVDWLDYNGYRLVTKAAREYVDTHGRKRFREDPDKCRAVLADIAAMHREGRLQGPPGPACFDLWKRLP